MKGPRVELRDVNVLTDPVEEILEEPRRRHLRAPRLEQLLHHRHEGFGRAEAALASSHEPEARGALAALRSVRPHPHADLYPGQDVRELGRDLGHVLTQRLLRLSRGIGGLVLLGVLDKGAPARGARGSVRVVVGTGREVPAAIVAPQPLRLPRLPRRGVGRLGRLGLHRN